MSAAIFPYLPFLTIRNFGTTGLFDYSLLKPITPRVPADPIHLAAAAQRLAVL